MQAMDRWVNRWLWLGVGLIFLQIIIGGVTRLTGSGLSITKWEIVTGTLPPLSESKWNEEFNLYKQSPQYRQINAGMSLSEFKFIYFWEYFHRLWARLMGIIFLIPFLWFYSKKAFPPGLLFRLVVIFLWAGVVASFGWIMVKSGLNDRPWVSPYKLTIHLMLAIGLFAYLLKTALQRTVSHEDVELPKGARSLLQWLTVLLVVQLTLGGLMSGMKAGLYYPTWPLMNGSFWPPAMADGSAWTLSKFTHFETNGFAIAFVQFFHRMAAYLLLIGLAVFYWQTVRKTFYTRLEIFIHVLGGLTLIQVVLGIVTVINCKGGIPVALGSLHQAGGILLLSAFVLVHHLIGKRPQRKRVIG